MIKFLQNYVSINIFIILTILSVLTSLTTNKYSNITNTQQFHQKTGDILQITLPLSIGTYGLITKNKILLKSFVKYFIISQAITHSLKAIVRRPRPYNKNRKDSFPSGHTSSAFTAPVFLHSKYGLATAIPFYALSTYTGYSRVVSNKHYITDIIGGIIVAFISLYIEAIIKFIIKKIKIYKSKQ